MEQKGVTKKRFLINVVGIILASAFAIVIHAVLPAPVDEIIFDGFFVRLFGFPAVAISYFLILFIHCAVVLQSFGSKSGLPKLEIGFRFGMAFALLYLMGMQEVVVEASPFNAWGYDYVLYQLFMGLGDAIPVLLLCLTLSCFISRPIKKSISINYLNFWRKATIVGLFSSSFFIQRVIGYVTGLVESNISTYPLQTYIWTVLFGAILGCAYIILYPVFATERKILPFTIKLSLITIGLNWIIFNSFIGLIFSGTMIQMFIRSGMDLIVFFLVSLLVFEYGIMQEEY